jgi:hypothetical protein
MTDVFVSYARIDDGTRGWVSTLVKELNETLGQHLGRRPTIFQDTSLPGNEPLTEEIKSALDASATLLVILSPSYLGSTWCKRELRWFLARSATRARCVFVAHFLDTAIATRPKPLRELNGYVFWEAGIKGTRSLGVPMPDRAYHDQLAVLAGELARTLRDVQAAAPVRARRHTMSGRAGLAAAEAPDARNALELKPNGSQPGSGYVITTGLAITARRLVHDHGSKICDVECRTAQGPWCKASLVAYGGDAAVLKADVKNGPSPVPWARWRRRSSIPCKFFGFRTALQGTGRIVPGTSDRKPTVELRPDDPHASQHAGIHGLEGAAVFAKNHLVGVISQIRQGDSTFEIAPIDRLARTLNRRKQGWSGELPDLSSLPYLEDITRVVLAPGQRVEELRKLLDDELAVDAVVTKEGDG